MIKSVEIFNYQSHKHTYLELDKGLNVFTGTSGHGKSAIQRAIEWVITNRPTGSSYVSWWALNSKDKQTDDTRVILTMDDDTVVERVRGNTINAYIINGKVLEAVGSDVPAEVQTALNFSDINYQVQLEAPFLLSESSGEVARYMNKVVNLEEADRYQVSVESKRKKCVQDATATEEIIKRTTDAMDTLSWVGKADKLSKRIEEMEIVLGAKEAEAHSMTDSVDAWDTAQGNLKLYSCTDKAVELCEKISLYSAHNAKQGLIASDIRGSLGQYSDYTKDRSLEGVVEQSLKLFKKIDKLRDVKKLVSDETWDIGSSLEEYGSMEGVYKESTKALIPLESELALVSICPTCGNRICKDKVVF